MMCPLSLRLEVYFYGPIIRTLFSIDHQAPPTVTHKSGEMPVIIVDLRERMVHRKPQDILLLAAGPNGPAAALTMRLAVG